MSAQDDALAAASDTPWPVEQNDGDIGKLLELEVLDDNLFRNRVNDININGALYGGQVLAQSLAAAVHTVEGRPPHSLHGYFVRSGDGRKPVIYNVERTRDGGSFSTRRVTGLQHGLPIFHMEASFHAGDEGFDYEVAPRLSAPDPDQLESLPELSHTFAEHLTDGLRRRLNNYKTLEIKPTDPERQLLRLSEVAENSFWTRVPSAETLAPEMHACALAYASDSWLAAATRMVHASPLNLDGLQLASLDHAMWFHAPVRADHWNLYETDSPWTGKGRGLARGTIYNRAGRLIASTAQEVLLRKRRS
jgi:acyl-CoA thioesterase-2